MQSERKIAEKIYSYLLKMEYPADSIVMNFRFTGFIADIAVIDTETKRPIAIFEIKKKSAPEDILQLKKYMAISPEANFYLVYPTDKENFFKIVQVFNNSKIEEFILEISPKKHFYGKKDMPKAFAQNYRQEVNASRTQQINSLENKLLRDKNIIKHIFFIAGILMIGALFYDVCCSPKFITLERLYAFGIIIILLILPFIGGIKFGNVEISFLKEIEKK